MTGLTLLPPGLLPGFSLRDGFDEAAYSKACVAYGWFIAQVFFETQ